MCQEKQVTLYGGLGLSDCARGCEGCECMSMGSTKRLLDELMAPDKPYCETDLKVGLFADLCREARMGGKGVLWLWPGDGLGDASLRWIQGGIIWKRKDPN